MPPGYVSGLPGPQNQKNQENLIILYFLYIPYITPPTRAFDNSAREDGVGWGGHEIHIKRTHFAHKKL